MTPRDFIRQILRTSPNPARCAAGSDGVMARYYFDVVDGKRKVVDEVGMDLPDFAAVRTEAFNLLRGIVHDSIPEGRHAMKVYVRDANGTVVYLGEMDVVGKRFRP